MQLLPAPIYCLMRELNFESDGNWGFDTPQGYNVSISRDPFYANPDAEPIALEVCVNGLTLDEFGVDYCMGGECCETIKTLLRKINYPVDRILRTKRLLALIQ